MKKEPKKTYHLYYHQPEPLMRAEAAAWLYGNGANYCMVASVQAYSVQEAYLAVREKQSGHGRLARFVHLQMHEARKTEPGDVLLGEYKAWMVQHDGQLEEVPYQLDTPYRSYQHDARVKSLDWSPDGRSIVTLSNEVSLYGVYMEQAAHYHRHERLVGSAVAWSPDGTLIASGGYDGEVHIWAPDPSGGYRDAAVGSILICRLGRGDTWHAQVSSLAWTPDSESVLAGRDDGTIFHWDATTGVCLEQYRRHAERVTALLYSPDGKRLASASNDGTLRIWQTEQLPAQDLVCPHEDRVSACAWSADGTLVVSAAEDAPLLRFWDAQTGACVGRIPLSIFSIRPLHILALAWSADGRFLAAGCNDGAVQIIDREMQRHVRTYRTSTSPREIRTLRWSPDGTLLATGGEDAWSGRGQLQIWQIYQ